jgi:hypothetical protein
MRRLVLPLACAAAGFLVHGEPATAHDPLGRAQPSVQTTVKGSGFSRVIAIRVTDLDSGNAIPNATLDLTATSPSGRRLTPAVTRLQPELFRSTLALDQPGRWRIAARIGGRSVVPTFFSVDVDVAGAASPPGRASSGGRSLALLVGVPVAVAVGLILVVVAVRRARTRRVR